MILLQSLLAQEYVEGDYAESNGILNAVLWEHPDYPGYFVAATWSVSGLKFVVAGQTDGAAIAFDDLFALAAQAQAELLPTLQPVTCTPNGGAHPASAVLSSDVAGVAIHYTTNGSQPTSASPLYSAPIAITGGTLLKTIAIKALWQNSPIKSFTFT